MKLNELIFTDGYIIKYREEKEFDKFVLIFCDYQNNELEITFYGNVLIENIDGVGVSFWDSRLSQVNNRQCLELINDENICIFRIEFTESEIEFRTIV